MDISMSRRFTYGGLATALLLVLVIKVAFVGQPLLQTKISDLSSRQDEGRDKESYGPIVAKEEGRTEEAKKNDQVAPATQPLQKNAVAIPEVDMKDQAAKPAAPAEIFEKSKRGVPSSTVQVMQEAMHQEAEALGTAPLMAGGAKVGRLRGIIASSDPNAGAALFANDALMALPEQNEKYSSVVENRRFTVAEQPVSTFSIDVDTGSYTNSRRFLKMGQLPPPDAVRIEEFVNYFSYNYPVQTEKPFTVSYEIAPSPLENDRMLLKVGVKAKDAKESGKPWNIVFLVDVSGSMEAANKLELVKRSLNVMVDKMRSGDKIGIVTYAGQTGVALEPAGIEQKEKIRSVINGLGAGGSTNGSGGITAAYDLAIQNKIAGGVNRVILATDGDFNVGISDTNELTRFIETKRESGITLTTLGFGEGNYREDIMELLADKGNGNYFYIDSFAEARKVFGEDLFGTIEVVAKDVKLQMEFNPTLVSEYRLIGYENRKLNREDFNNDKVDAGEIGSGHTVTALYELILTGSKAAGSVDPLRYQNQTPQAAAPVQGNATEIGFLKIRFKEPEGSTSQLLSYPVAKSDMRDDWKKTSDDFRFAAAVSYFAHKLRHSNFAGNYSYEDVAKLAEAAIGTDSFGHRRELVELVRNAAEIGTKREVIAERK